jgi:hypothetical protein
VGRDILSIPGVANEPCLAPRTGRSLNVHWSVGRGSRASTRHRHAKNKEFGAKTLQGSPSTGSNHKSQDQRWQGVRTTVNPLALDKRELSGTLGELCPFR